MESALWRMPARLLTRDLRATPTSRTAARTELAHGSLHEMVCLATGAGTSEVLLLCIDCVGAPRPLVWADIVALREDASFPVDV